MTTLHKTLALCLVSMLLCAYGAHADQPANLEQLDLKFQRIHDFIGQDRFGPGAPDVLEVAYLALRKKHAAGEAQLVGLEDLWSHALQEGLALFNQPDKLWGKTTAEQTADMIGQTTIGPWQMTLWNIRDNYGPRYGIDPKWDNAKIYAFCREHPDVQASMIIDYIQLSYETFGKRSPYAIQRYFWLEPFVKGELGQAEDWTKSVVAKPPPGGTWQDLTPEMKADTGFYAKQILLGAPYTKTGLLFWLKVTKDDDAIREVLRTWRDQKKIVVADPQDAPGTPEAPGTMVMENIHYITTDQPGGFTIKPEDVVFYKDQPKIHHAILKLIDEVAVEQP